MSAYTRQAVPAGEARIQSDLDRIVQAVRAEGEGDGLIQVLLLGGYARGEGTAVRAPDGTWRGFNDYDLLLVFEDEMPPAGPYEALSRRLAKELEIDFVDLGMVLASVLPHVPATLFWYELGAAHRVLWSRDGDSPRIRKFEIGDIDPWESTDLLCNRGMALVWAALRLWPTETPGRGERSADAETLRFATIAAHKAILASGDAALLRSGHYTPSQSERARMLEADPAHTAWAPRGFLAAYRRAVAFRETPVIGSSADTAALWADARRFFEAGYRASESDRMQCDLASWDAYDRILRATIWRQEYGTPSAALRTWVRRARNRPLASETLRRALGMARLLFQPETPVWRAEAEALVGRWHP